MEPISGEKRRVLYHAVSSYQLLEAVLHRLRFHPGDPAVLLLPDFIAEKYPNTGGWWSGGSSRRLRLFPYLRVPHRSEEEVFARGRPGLPEGAALPLGGLLPGLCGGGPLLLYPCASSRRASPSPFSRTRRGCSPGRGSWRRTWRGATPSTRPSRAKYGLFDGSCPLAREIVCLKSAQRGPLPPHCADFSVELALEELSPGCGTSWCGCFCPIPCAPGGGHPPDPASGQFGGCHLGGASAGCTSAWPRGPSKGCGCSSSPTPTTAWITGRSSPKPGCCGRCSRRSCCPTPFWWGPGWCTPWIPPAAKT